MFCKFASPSGFQSTLPMRGATLSCVKGYTKTVISIHTPHAGSDQYVALFSAALLFQSTLPMRGATFGPFNAASCSSVFQSTLPMRGATYSWMIYWNLPKNFNPHSPCGERHQCKTCLHLIYLFQSTLPMRGATFDGVAWTMDRMKFQSTLPMRGATIQGEKKMPKYRFQSTLPMRGATKSRAGRNQKF